MRTLPGFLAAAARSRTVRRRLRSATLALLLCGGASSASGQIAPTLGLPEEAPANALVGSSGPEWGNGDEGVGFFSGVGYERRLLPRLILRLDFNQGYNDRGDRRVSEFLLGGVPVRESVFTDFLRLTFGAQLGYLQPLGDSRRAVVFAGPVWTRVSQRQNIILTDLRFGDQFQESRETFSDNFAGALVGFGLEFDITDEVAYRLMLLHNRAAEDNTTAVALGGSFKF